MEPWTVTGTIATIAGFLVAAIAFFLRKEYKNRINDLKEKHNKELQNLTKTKGDLRQIEKIIYEKFLYIKSRNGKSVYRAYVDRIEDEVEVFDEKFSIRINKFSETVPLTTRDRSSGIIDLSFLIPFKRELDFPDAPSKKSLDTILQDLDGESTYVGVSTYYNGFQMGNEDLRTMLEMDTDIVRFIADFTSIPDIEQIFLNEPDLFLEKPDKTKKDISRNLKKLQKGLYYVEIHDLKKRDVILLDFHIDWKYLERETSLPFDGS